jgi:hypothetical protein
VYEVMDKFIAAESGPIPQVKLPTKSNAGKKLSD